MMTFSWTMGSGRNHLPAGMHLLTGCKAVGVECNTKHAADWEVVQNLVVNWRGDDHKVTQSWTPISEWTGFGSTRGCL